MDENKALNKIIQRQSWALDSMRVHVEGLEGAIKSLKSKLKEHPEVAAWSINHDVLKWARLVHSKCYELHILSEMRNLSQEQISAKKSKNSKSKKEK